VSLIFLDFDGVLNSQEYFLTPQGRGKFGRLSPEMFDPRAIAILDTLVDQTGAQIVLSTAWRMAASIYAIKDALIRAGFKNTIRIVGSTPYINNRRGVEIALWLRDHPDVTSYVVFDDRDIRGHGSRFIRTSFADGLKSEHARRAKAILLA